MDSEDPPAEETHIEDLNLLRLSFGEVLQIQLVGESERFHVRLVGYLENRSIIVTTPIKNHKAVPVRAGQVIYVRMMVNGQACAFTSTILHLNRVPYLHMHIEYPHDLIINNIRKAIRVDVRVEGSVVNNSIGSRSKHVDCHLADISETGAHLVTPIRIGKTGDEIGLSLPVQIAEISRTLDITAIVRSRLKIKSEGKRREVHYGVEFLPGSEEQRIELIAFIYSNLTLG